MQYKLYVTSDLVVVGENPEMADMSNPHGQIFGEAYRVVAEFEDGSRRAKKIGVHDLMSEAVKVLGVISLALDSGAEDWRDWREVQAVYGSQAYVDGDWEYEQMLREREEG